MQTGYALINTYVWVFVAIEEIHIPTLEVHFL